MHAVEHFLLVALYGLSIMSAQNVESSSPRLTAVGCNAALLRALTRGPATGAMLIRRVSKLTRGRVKLGNGAAYRAINHLEAAGLIRDCTTAEQREDHSRLRWFALTRQGATAAKEIRVALLGLSVKPGPDPFAGDTEV